MAKAKAALPDGATAIQEVRGGKVSLLRQVLSHGEKGDSEALATARECFRTCSGSMGTSSASPSPP
ncbi:MAG TPA: hypothetical protein VK689_23690 [Armatimonadota bacterium]|nr:hypothetical protein [Armatimonadota bacterium]